MFVLHNWGGGLPINIMYIIFILTAHRGLNHIYLKFMTFSKICLTRAFKMSQQLFFCVVGMEADKLLHTAYRSFLTVLQMTIF